MTPLTFDNFQSPARTFSPRAPKRSVKKVLYFSLLLHFVLILVIASQTGTTVKHEAQPAPITARLFYATPPRREVNGVSRTTEAPVAKSEHIETAQEALEQRDTEREASAVTVNESDELSGPLGPESTQTTARESDLPAQQPEQPPRRLSLGDMNAAREILRQQQALAIQRDARQAVSDFQRLKTQPELIDPRKGREEQKSEIKPVEVNCQSTTNAILTTLSGFAGGTLKCSERNGFEKFVEKRVNKEN